MQLTRLIVFILVTVSINSLCSCWADAFSNSEADGLPIFHAVVPRQQLPTAKKNEILKWVRNQEWMYNPAEAMLQKNHTIPTPPFNSTLNGGKVHPIRDAAIYAVALLDCEDNAMEKRAFDVLRKVLSLQDTKNDSNTYGLWSLYLEEPLDKMPRVDGNMADFISTNLLQVVINHNERLPADLATNMAFALIHAARFITKRKFQPAHTSIAIVGSHTLLAVSDIYNIADMQQLALQRLRIFANYTKTNGGFDEYNSPSYTIYALEELGRLKMHAILTEAKQIVEELYYVAWKEIIDHYHPATEQLAGPHSRSYRTILGGGHAKLLREWRNKEFDPRLPLPIPDDLYQIFVQNPTIPRTVTNTYARAISGTRPDLVGTTYLDVLWTVGSITWADMWVDRRPLVAYWNNNNKTSYFQLRFLHDHYDFASAQFYGVQKQGQILAGLVLATNGGDKHISVDSIKNATISANDLRLRFQIGGSDASSTSVTTPDLNHPNKFKFGNMTLQFSLANVHFHNQSAQYWNVSREKDLLYIDYVLFHGVQQNIKLDTWKAAAMIVAVQFSNDDSAWVQPTTIVQGDVVQAEWQDLCLEMQTKPDTVAQLLKTVKHGC